MPATTAQFNQKLRQFFRWWWPNFCFWLPDALQAYYLKFKPINLDIFYGEDEQLNCRYDLNGHLHNFTVPVGSTNELTLALEQNPLLKNARIRLFLPKHMVIYREITLPKVNQDELNTLIQYQLEVLTPFKPQEIYFDTLITKEDDEHIDVCLFILQKIVADTLSDRLGSMGIKPSFFMSAQFCKAFPDYKTSYNLIPQTNKVTLKSKNTVFYSAIASLLLAIIAFPFFADSYSLDVIDTQIALLQKSNKQMSSSESKINQYFEKYNQLDAIYKQYHHPRNVIDEITRAIDPKSWIIHMLLTNSKIELQGFTENSATLLQLFENSKAFKKVHFLSPTSRDKVTNMEKFHLSMEFED